MYEILLTDLYRLSFNVEEAAANVLKNSKHETSIEIVTVHLGSATMTSPELAFDMYHKGVTTFETYQQLMLQSVGLPADMADTSVKPPLRMEAQTKEEIIEIDGANKNNDNNNHVAKKVKVSKSDDD
jgi:hypothetical protein